MSRIRFESAPKHQWAFGIFLDMEADLAFVFFKWAFVIDFKTTKPKE